MVRVAFVHGFKLHVGKVSALLTKYNLGEMEDDLLSDDQEATLTGLFKDMARKKAGEDHISSSDDAGETTRSEVDSSTAEREIEKTMQESQHENARIEEENADDTERHTASCDVKIFTPFVSGYRPQYFYICFDWLFIFAARDVSHELQKPIPATFKTLHNRLNGGDS